jgi:signal peptidase I
MRAALRDTGETIITAVVIFLILQGTTQSFLIDGASMKPTLLQNERMLVNRFVYIQSPFSLFGAKEYLFGGPKRGDIVVFHPPTGSDIDFVKRIIGMPGDWIDLDGNSVYVQVPQGEYFVLGDNRRVSVDSRNWGFVAAHDLVGRAWAVYWPLNEFQLYR